MSTWETRPSDDFSLRHPGGPSEGRCQVAPQRGLGRLGRAERLGWRGSRVVEGVTGLAGGIFIRLPGGVWTPPHLGLSLESPSWRRVAGAGSRFQARPNWAGSHRPKRARRGARYMERSGANGKSFSINFRALGTFAMGQVSSCASEQDSPALSRLPRGTSARVVRGPGFPPDRYRGGPESPFRSPWRYG